MSSRFELKAGVTLDAAASAFATKVAEKFFLATGKTLVVTSAYRGPHEQAAAMFVKMSGPEWDIYTNKAALLPIRVTCSPEIMPLVS